MRIVTPRQFITFFVDNSCAVFYIYLHFLISNNNLLLGSLHSLYSGFQKGPN